MQNPETGLVGVAKDAVVRLVKAGVRLGGLHGTGGAAGHPASAEMGKDDFNALQAQGLLSASDTPDETV